MKQVNLLYMALQLYNLVHRSFQSFAFDFVKVSGMFVCKVCMSTHM